MERKSRQRPEIRDFILRNIPTHAGDIGTVAGTHFGLSRTAINRYLTRLRGDGLISAEGRTNARTYSLLNYSQHINEIELTSTTAEHQVWREQIAPFIVNMPDNITNICHHGFTEIFNNVIDHSDSKTAFISYSQNYVRIEMLISDRGVGIFDKIQKKFNYDDPRTALLELSKGKLTTDAKRHSGEGIFFTSKMFNRFTILSGHLGYSSQKEDDWGWLIETEDLFEAQVGTCVRMQIATDATWSIGDIFKKYEGDAIDENVRPFTKTHVPIKLAKYGNEQLISRSQAKRLLSRFDRFSEILLDFQGVLEIGQAFADEIFRVFTQEHPHIRLITLGTTPEIDNMIARVRANANELDLRAPDTSSAPPASRA
jgi:anti-sigma regulatory factor (Ser/Thr protein kinase)